MVDSKPHWEPVRITDRRATDSKAENNYDVTFYLGGDHHREEWREFLQSSEVKDGQASPDFQVSRSGEVSVSVQTGNEAETLFHILAGRIRRANKKMEDEVLPRELKAWSDKMEKQKKVEERTQKMQEFLDRLPSGQEERD